MGVLVQVIAAVLCQWRLRKESESNADWPESAFIGTSEPPLSLVRDITFKTTKGLFYTVCFSCMNMGIIVAWPSSTILLFKSENTTLHRPMANIEISFFSSLATLGSLIGHPIIIGYILDKLGRKYTAILASSTFVIEWSMIAWTNKVEVILPAMFMGGLGCTIFLEILIYISEISQNSIRGTLTSGPNLFFNSGCLLSYFLGGALEYHTMVYTSLMLAVIGVLMIMLLKDSPVSLLVKGREEDAAKSIAFYRRKGSTSKEVITELSSIRRTVHKKDIQDAQSLTKGTEISESGTKKMTCWEIFKTSSATRRQFYLVIVLKTAYVCQGLPVIMVYAKPMFASTVGEDISPDLCSVLLGFVTLVTGTIAAYLIDKIGRRPLQIHASIAAGICCAVLGTQILTDWFPKWTIPLFVYVYAISHTVGSGTVPLVVSAEIFLPEVKSVLLTLAAEWLLLCYFGFLFLFGFLIQTTGLAPVFFCFSVTCFSTAVYFFYYLPETKGLSAHAIQALFMKSID